MNSISYQIRTVRDTPVFSFDSLARAQEEKLRAEQRIGCKMKLVKVTHIEEVICD